MAFGDRRRSALQRQLQGKELSPVREKLGIYTIAILVIFATLLIIYTSIRTISYNLTGSSAEGVEEVLRPEDILDEDEYD